MNAPDEGTSAAEPPDPLSDLDRRLGRLGRDAYLWKGFVCIGIIALALVLGRRFSGSPCADTIDARSLRLLDEEGRVRVDFQAQPSGDITLALLDESDRRAAILESMLDRTARFELSGSNSNFLIWHVIPRSIASLLILNKDHRTTGAFYWDRQEKSGLYLGQGDRSLLWQADPDQAARLTETRQRRHDDRLVAAPRISALPTGKPPRPPGHDNPSRPLQ